MARMLPPYYRDDRASNAEIKMFRAFEKLDMNCTVFHSLSLGKHLDKVFGEIDFVIVCEMGVLCLEVKGGAVYRSGGIWHFEDRYGNVSTSTEGPFKQAVGNMYSLRKYIKKHLGAVHSLTRCQYACGVVFPDFAFNRKGPDFIPEIVYDNRYTDEELKKYIKDVFAYWRKVTREKHNFEGAYLSGKEIREAENILRGNFSCVPSLGNIADKIDKRLIELTEEQYNILRMIEENKRVIIKGGAGTGKTLLALEHARRQAAKGKNVLYLCFNRLISSYLNYVLKKDNSEFSRSIDVTNFHEFLRRYVNKNSVDDRYNRDVLFTIIMPEKFIEYCMNNRIDKKYEAVILDEGQDLLRITYLFCVNEILEGGIKDGNWYVFFDPNQNIYNREFEEGYRFLEEYRPVIASLNINCRNTRQIGTYNVLLTGFRQDEIMKISGEDVERIEYKDNKDLQNKLLKLVKRLISNGIGAGNIAILSSYSFKNSGIEGKNIFESVCKFQNISGMKYNIFLEDSLKFSTVQSFKGMESRVVILIDMEKFAEPEMRLLNYTAISRARVLLYIFYKNSSVDEMDSVITESLGKYKNELN